MNAKRCSLLMVALFAAVSATVLIGPPPVGPIAAEAQVNGTRPTRLTVLAPTVLSGNRLQVRCRLTTLSGAPLAGLYPVELYALYGSYSTRLGMANTDNNGYGYATDIITRPAAGTVLGWNYAGNGAYSRPLHQLAAP